MLKFKAHILNNPINVLFVFRCFFHHPTNLTHIAPSFNHKPPSFWRHSSHQPFGYPSTTMFPWQWMHMYVWCHLRCLRIHGKRNYFTFHVVWKNLHILGIQSWVEIPFSEDGFLTLTNIVIANPTYVNILSQTSCAWSFASLKVD